MSTRSSKISRFFWSSAPPSDTAATRSPHAQLLRLGQNFRIVVDDLVIERTVTPKRTSRLAVLLSVRRKHGVNLKNHLWSRHFQIPSLAPSGPHNHSRRRGLQ